MLHILKNKYVIVLLVVGSYLLFFDSYSIGVQYKLSKELNRLKSETEQYRQAFVQDSIHYQNLINKPESIERYAREHLYMKKANEDIYLIEYIEDEK